MFCAELFCKEQKQDKVCSYAMKRPKFAQK